MSVNPRPAAEQIEEHRDALEELADSSLPCAEIADTLLQVCDDE